MSLYDRSAEDFKIVAADLLHRAYDQADPDRVRYPTINKHMIINGRVEEVKRVMVLQFDLVEWTDHSAKMAYTTLSDWCESDQGQWVLQNALVAPEWNMILSPMTFSWNVMVTTKIAGAPLTEWLLKYGTDTVSSY